MRLTSGTPRTATPAARPVSGITSSILNFITHILLASFVHLLNDLGMVAEKSAYFALSLLVLTLGFFELQIERRRDPRRWLVNPAVLATLFTFALNYGVTNYLFLLPVSSGYLISRDMEFFASMATGQYYTVLALVALWFGYRLSLGRQIGRKLAAYFPVSRGTSVRNSLLIALMVVAIAARSYQVSIGVFGYVASADSLEAQASITQYLAMASLLGQLALAIAALKAYRPAASSMDMLLMWVFVVVEVTFGFLSGFKAAAVMPMMVVVLCRYMAGRGISRTYLLSAIALLVLAYAIIEPFRQSYNSQGRTGVSGFASIASILAGSDSVAQSGPVIQANFFHEVAVRQNLSYIGAYGIDYANDPDRHSPDDPKFLEQILLSPVIAIVPRVVWPSKPLSNSGHWYTTQVLGQDSISSTAMGPVSFLYMAGGVTAVMFFFAIIGMIQRALLVWFNPWASFGGAIAYLGVVGTVASINSAVDSLFVTVLRNVPIILILSHLIIIRGNRT